MERCHFYDQFICSIQLTHNFELGALVDALWKRHDFMFHNDYDTNWPIVCQLAVLMFDVHVIQPVPLFCATMREYPIAYAGKQINSRVTRPSSRVNKHSYNCCLWYPKPLCISTEIRYGVQAVYLLPNINYHAARQKLREHSPTYSLAVNQLFAVLYILHLTLPLSMNYHLTNAW